MIDLNNPFNLEIIQKLPWKTAPLAKLNTLTKKDALKAEMDHAGIYSLHNPTTSCQFRSGMELLCLGI